MPLARLAGVSGYLNDEQKKELIEKVTDAIVSVEGEGPPSGRLPAATANTAALCS